MHSNKVGTQSSVIISAVSFKRGTVEPFDPKHLEMRSPWGCTLAHPKYIPLIPENEAIFLIRTLSVNFQDIQNGGGPLYSELPLCALDTNLENVIGFGSCDPRWER